MKPPVIYAVFKNGKYAGAIIKNGFVGTDDQGRDKPGKDYAMLRRADEAIERAKSRGYVVKVVALKQLKALIKAPSSPAQTNIEGETSQKSLGL